MNLKNYLVKAEIEEGRPDYTFIVKAYNLPEAYKSAERIVRLDYGDVFDFTDVVLEVNEIKDFNWLVGRLDLTWAVDKSIKVITYKSL